MGLKAKVVNATFDGIIPGLAAGKYDIGASSFTDTKAREKTVDFVDYFSAGESFFTKASGGVAVTSARRHSAARRSPSRRAPPRRPTPRRRARSAAASRVTVLSFPDQNGANLALSSGRAQLGFADSPPAAYQVKKSNGQFKLVGPTFADRAVRPRDPEERAV